MTDAREKYQELLVRFEEQANAEQASRMAAYMKNHFPFYGVQTPIRRTLYKDIIIADKKNGKIDWDLLNLVWSQEKRELHYFVCDYLKGLHKFLSYDDVPLILTFAKSNQWWDTIDYFDRILGNIYDDRIPSLMLELSQSEDFWLRRIAIDHQLGRKDKTDTALLEEIITNNFGSKEFFINKAIGWSLRDYSKVNPDWVRDFVITYQEDLAPLSFREASKYI
ncbi:DNA alkylation repair protein [Streptococcus parauberis]|uniref:DNA alkylation repair protein n=1 Tax=Streptococcus parauberis TaxID=1348 RepID=UPI000C1CA209|nr:DNA alkylation repair protein [Streptococcus parauberis]PIO79114.1 DNA alkylation repair enzyme [Streptococcus parauberis]POS67226.1 DNA alkylation repair enzyme [Streptococcus parauberis]